MPSPEGLDNEGHPRSQALTIARRAAKPLAFLTAATTAVVFAGPPIKDKLDYWDKKQRSEVKVYEVKKDNSGFDHGRYIERGQASTYVSGIDPKTHAVYETDEKNNGTYEMIISCSGLNKAQVKFRHDDKKASSAEQTSIEACDDGRIGQKEIDAEAGLHPTATAIDGTRIDGLDPAINQAALGADLTNLVITAPEG